MIIVNQENNTIIEVIKISLRDNFIDVETCDGKTETIAEYKTMEEAKENFIELISLIRKKGFCDLSMSVKEKHEFTNQSLNNWNC